MQSNVAGSTDDGKGILEKGGELIKRIQGLYGATESSSRRQRGWVEGISCRQRWLTLISSLLETSAAKIELWNWHKGRTRIALRQSYATWIPSAGRVPRSHWNNCGCWQSAPRREGSEPEPPAQICQAHMPEGSKAHARFFLSPSWELPGKHSDPESQRVCIFPDKSMWIYLS